ncbi:XRE family transcriptional regulator (plasmid) [Bacillus mycoides]|uniref:helix-turn-helix domain-containing protein n=1 Tax=Bacillus mycoides TaxID=1405 RepID=UPI001C019325|nr:helix-turn-helix transcriptional regulator [Bacillus mycoides]QWH75365.1 XRE family transcriptional regulator [Bacillus mycoides]QWI47292.1 XRE family transcriptional regulator [Bacillus mycoides]
MVNNQDYTFTAMRNIREETGMTIKQVATDLRVNPRVLQEIETGKKGTNAKRAHLIATYFGIPIEVLFTPIYYRAKVT